jgi:hypothetical protein
MGKGKMDQLNYGQNIMAMILRRMKWVSSAGNKRDAYGFQYNFFFSYTNFQIKQNDYSLNPPTLRKVRQLIPIKKSYFLFMQYIRYIYEQF